MAIIVRCDCGKKFKAKDSLAGKRVRCPGCKEPVRVEAGAPVAAGKGRDDSSSGFDPQEALLKYEAAQKKKQQTAAEEAAREEEKNKLIASYDQLSGKKKQKGQKKDELAGSKATKPTVVTKAADAGGTVLSNPLVKYFIIAGLLGAGAYGSAKLWQYVGNYTSEEVRVGPKPEVRIAELELASRKAAASGKPDEAQLHLDEILKIYPKYKEERPRDYDDLVRRIERARNSQG